MAPSAGEPWSPARLPRDTVTDLPPAPVSPEVMARRDALTLTDVVDVALRNSPTTRIAWRNARAAAASYGSARGTWLPTVNGAVSASDVRTAGAGGQTAVQQQLWGPSASFTWLLFDFNRPSLVGAARQALIAADWTHNAAVQDVVLQVGQAYYSYAAAKALLVAQRATQAEADTNLAAAEERRRVGVATIADVLQARTAAAQARLEVQRTEGTVAATRGALAVATGYPATADFDVDSLAAEGPIGPIADSVEALIALARASRPDLGAALATAAQARAQAHAALGRRLPALTATGSAARTYLSTSNDPRESYNIGVGLSVPLFNGFSWEYDAQAARERAAAQEARAQQLGQQAVLQVFTDYYALRTATANVRTVEDLYASASQAADAARGRYRAGVGSLLELLTAEAALGSARATRVQSRLEWHLALLQLAHDVGVLDPRGGHPFRVLPDTTSTGPSR